MPLRLYPSGRSDAVRAQSVVAVASIRPAALAVRPGPAARAGFFLPPNR